MCRRGSQPFEVSLFPVLFLADYLQILLIKERQAIRVQTVP